MFKIQNCLITSHYTSYVLFSDERGMVGPLSDLSVLRVTKAYSGLDLLDMPMVTTMGMSATKSLAESEFGPVQRASVLFYQQPKLLSKNIVLHQNATPSPNLPLEAHKLSPMLCVWVCTEEEQLHWQSLTMSMEMAHKIEVSTRERSIQELYSIQMYF